MDLLVLDSNLEIVSILDTYESLIWTERYSSPGDFEVYTKVTLEILSTLTLDRYIYSPTSDYVMVIEERKIEFDAEDGHRLLVRGRSAESILDRRIIWSQTILDGNLQNGIEQLINENVISPTIPERVISNIAFVESIDSAITSLTVKAQYTRTNLLETIQKLCAANDIGFKMTLSSSFDSFEFKLYSSVDRSYNQVLNSYVVFSNGFENLSSSDYIESMVTYKNITVVAGAGEDEDRIIKIVGDGEGVSRRELYTDARDLSDKVDNVAIPEVDYLAQLEQRGIEKLLENDLEVSFDGKVDITRMFKYREDFFVGDIVQLVGDYGIEGRVQIMGMIRSINLDGIDVYPTFKIID